MNHRLDNLLRESSYYTNNLILIIRKTFKPFFLSPAGRTQCWIEMSPWQWKLYLSIVATTVFVVPAIVISGCYAIIVYTIWSKSKLLSPAKNNTLQRGAKSELLYYNYDIIGTIDTCIY
jgi:hypothetical protein